MAGGLYLQQTRSRRRSTQCCVCAATVMTDDLAAANTANPESMWICGGKFARYNTGMPIPRPQSLAKIKVCESSSQAGEELLQFPPATSCSLPLTRSRNQMCLGPASVDSTAIHFPSGESTEPSAGTVGIKVVGTTLLVAGSKIMDVDEPFFTSSR